MTDAMKKYEVLLPLVKWNEIPPDQEKIVALASIAEKLDNNNLKLTRSVKSALKKGKRNRNKIQQGNNKNGNKFTVNKQKQKNPQDQWKIEYPKEGG